MKELGVQNDSNYKKKWWISEFSGVGITGYLCRKGSIENQVSAKTKDTTCVKSELAGTQYL